MIRAGWVAVCCTMTIFLVGCQSDEREGQVSTTVTIAGDVAARLNTINKTVAKALESTDKGLKLEDAEKMCDELGNKGKELQLHFQKIQALKAGLTTEERERFDEQFRNSITDAVTKMDERTRALNETLSKMDELVKDNPGFEKAAKNFRLKLRDAQGQFETLNRLQ